MSPFYLYVFDLTDMDHGIGPDVYRALGELRVELQQAFSGVPVMGWRSVSPRSHTHNVEFQLFSVGMSPIVVVVQSMIMMVALPWQAMEFFQFVVNQLVVVVVGGKDHNNQITNDHQSPSSFMTTIAERGTGLPVQGGRLSG